jgi:hypothetical protein
MRVTPITKTVRQSPIATTIQPTPIAKVVRHLEAGEWKAAHALVQKDATSLGCWAHGIVHLIEGDLENAKYWYRRAHRPLPHGNTAAAEIAALKASVKQGTQ